MNLVVCGLGRMGLPIALRLIRAGHRVSGWDVSAARVAVARGLGVSAAGTPPPLLEEADVLLTVLPGPAEVSSAVLADRVRGRMRPGSCWLDLTSNDPRTAAAVAAALGQRDVASVAAPMGGGPEDARHGRLRFFVGGPTSAVRTIRPLLDTVARKDGVETVGESVEDGHLTKLLANFLWFSQVVAVSEAALLAQRLGVEPDRLHGPLAASAGGSGFLDHHFAALLDGDYLTDFALDRCVEELRTLRSLATTADLPSELLSLVTRLHEEALDRFGPVDGELMAAKLLEERAGRQIRRASRLDSTAHPRSPIHRPHRSGDAQS